MSETRKNILLNKCLECDHYKTRYMNELTYSEKKIEEYKSIAIELQSMLKNKNESTIHNEEEKIRKLEEKNKKLEDKNNKLEDKNKKLEEKIISIGEIIKQQERDNYNLNARLITKEENNSICGSELSSISKRGGRKKGQINKKTREMMEKKKEEILSNIPNIPNDENDLED